MSLPIIHYIIMYDRSTITLKDRIYCMQSNTCLYNEMYSQPSVFSFSIQIMNLAQSWSVESDLNSTTGIYTLMLFKVPHTENIPTLTSLQFKEFWSPNNSALIAGITYRHFVPFIIGTTWHPPVFGGFLLTFIQSKVCAEDAPSDRGEQQASRWAACRGDSGFEHPGKGVVCSCPPP